MIRLACAVALLTLALSHGPGCGGREAPAPASGWRHCRIRGLERASGLAVHEGELFLVAGGGNRAVYVVHRNGLEHGGQTACHTLALERDDDATLAGSDKFARQGYRLGHLWALPQDFQAVAVQPPDFVYVGERSHRIVYWGQLTRDAAGRTRSARLRGAFALPGAQRTGAESGDWSDHGPGLSGLTAVTARRRTEDLYAVDRGLPEATRVVLHKMSRHGSPLGILRILRMPRGEPAIEALAARDGAFALLDGQGSGRLAHAPEPRGSVRVDLDAGEETPQIPGAGAWRGMAYAADGTLYLVSDGSPAVVAWRAPRGE